MSTPTDPRGGALPSKPPRVAALSFLTQSPAVSSSSTGIASSTLPSDDRSSHPSVAITAFLSLTDGSILYQGRRYKPLPSPPSLHPLLHCLQPVRTLLHPFLTDTDAGRLLRVSRTTAQVLLPGFTFREHVFCGESDRQMRCLKALYEKYDMRPTRMCLSEEMQRLALDGGGLSPLPTSLTSLLLGPLPSSSRWGERSVFTSDPIQLPSFSHQCTGLSGEETDDEYRAMLRPPFSFPARIRRSSGPFNCTLSPGLLPHGLRRLHLAGTFNTPLLPGSIPSTVELLFCEKFTQPFLVGGVSVLPTSLVVLSMAHFNQPLSPNILPPSLQRLHLLRWDQPLHVNVLPSSLRFLQLGGYRHVLPPDLLPAGLTHLQVAYLSQPLQHGSLPPSLVCLEVGHISAEELHSGQ